MPGLVRAVWARGGGVFEVKPYLQLGDAPGPAGGPERFTLLWQTADRDAGPGRSRSAAAGGGPWVGGRERRRPGGSRSTGSPPFRLYRAALTGLGPGEAFAYRVRRARGRRVRGRGPGPEAGGPAAAVRRLRRRRGGHLGAERRSPTRRTGPGPITWSSPATWSTCAGRASEYLDHFFPVYNSDPAGRAWGAPLLRSTPFLAAPGNHDLIERDLDTHPDGLAYFYYWAQPLNGPEAPRRVAGVPAPEGLARAGRRRSSTPPAPAYPRMANYSFDYGDVHWTVLDTNTYVDWTDPALRAWLEADLASAPPAARPGGSSPSTTRRSTRRRPTPRTSGRGCSPDVFEDHKVALVFNGHVHNYQRTHPLTVRRRPPAADGRSTAPTGRSAGRWTLDTAYDGRTRTRPDGVIYVVTGAGGARLYNTEQGDDPASWQPYTARLVSNTHSLTVVDVTPGALTVRQVSDAGAEIDRFAVSR